MSDVEDDNGFVPLEYPPPNHYLSPLLPIKIWQETDASTTNTRLGPMKSEVFERFTDADGRLIDEHSFRHAVFKGGIDPLIRCEVWKLLFGLYHCHSTRREREIVSLQLKAKYEALKQRWQERLETSQNESREWFACSTPQFTSASLSSSEIAKQFLVLQAQIFAGREPFAADKLVELVKCIDKDVPRTNRRHSLFRHDESPYLVMLRNILITFAAFHEHIGYAQGMNDIASRFLLVMDDESDAYWCFTNFVERIQIDFLEEGMIKKLELLSDLLREIDCDLYNYLSECQVHDLAFCHRWLLLSFLREFDFEEGLRMFEILSSHYLEMNSLEAETVIERSRQTISEQGCGLSEYQIPADSQLTFILFVCVAILMMNRTHLFACSDLVSVFQCVNSLTHKFTVDEILAKAELLFYAYCKKSVVETFQMIESSNEKI